MSGSSTPHLSPSESGWIDAHCHLADERLASSVDAVIQRARAAGIWHFVQGGVDPADWDRQLALFSKYPEILSCTFGLHPVWVAHQTQPDCAQALSRLEPLLTRAVAIGEIGLHYHPTLAKETYPRQQAFFEAQLELAARLNQPVILHIVRAHADALALLKRNWPRQGMVHSFSGSPQEARRYLEHGFLLSISGAVTQEKFKRLREVVPMIPLDALLIESDAPDQSPAGTPADQLNEPTALFQTAKIVAELKKTNPEVILNRSAENLRKLLGPTRH